MTNEHRAMILGAYSDFFEECERTGRVPNPVTIARYKSVVLRFLADGFFVRGNKYLR